MGGALEFVRVFILHAESGHTRLLLDFIHPYPSPTTTFPTVLPLWKSKIASLI